MKYYLQDYEQDLSMQLKRVYKTGHSLAEALDFYERNAEYSNFETSAIWAIWRMLARFVDCYSLYDKMRIEKEDFKDSHLVTLVRNSIKATYGHSITELLAIYRGTK